MKVSVVIPVYNAARYVEQAVQSALEQPEVAEVILVEDGSPDASLEVCQSLAARHERVLLFTHEGRENRGAGASRNVGIRKSKAPYVAFLDADDFFLPGRFERTKHVFSKHPDAEGVYEAVGTHFMSGALERQWYAQQSKPVTTVESEIEPERLFWEQSPIGPMGYAPTGGWTLRRTVFQKTGLFNADLPLHQDTDLFMRFAMAARMYPGEIEQPVARRRVHDRNRIGRERPPKEVFKLRVDMWTAAWRWARANGYAQEASVLLTKLLDCCERERLRTLGYGPFTTVYQFCQAAWYHPILLGEPRFYRRLLRIYLRKIKDKLSQVR